VGKAVEIAQLDKGSEKMSSEPYFSRRKWFPSTYLKKLKLFVNPY